MWLAERQITLGCAPEAFCPTDPVTREQMASFLARALNLPRILTDQFVDISSSRHVPDIGALVAAGITQGCEVDLFCPQDPVTREQMASFLVRGLGLPAGPDLFTDDEGSVHEADINALAQAGITLGCAEDVFCPGDIVTREQMAAFIYRSFDH